MRFADIKALVQEALDSVVYPEVDIVPGPELPETSDRFILLTRFGGGGEEYEGLFDAISWQVRVVGMQGDYEDGENLALLIDRYFITQPTRFVGEARILPIVRLGSPPVAFLVDDADRHHFVCSYSITVGSYQSLGGLST